MEPLQICGVPSRLHHAAPFPGALLGAGHPPQTASPAPFGESRFGVCGMVKEMTGSSTLMGDQLWEEEGRLTFHSDPQALGKESHPWD